MKLKIQKTNPFAILPKKAHPDDAGFDIFLPKMFPPTPENPRYKERKFFIRKNHVEFIPLGFKTEIPEGYYGAIYIRSSLGKKGVVLSNGTGIIDAGYRGEWGIMLTAIGAMTQIVMPGERVAQLILRKIEPFEIEETNDLSDTDRGVGGFGSTGR